MSEYDILNRDVPLQDKTPVTQAAEIIMILSGMWENDFNEDMSHKKILIELLNNENADGQRLKQDLLNWSSYVHKDVYLQMLRIIFSYCVQAIKEYMGNNEMPTNLAWAYVVEAERELSALDNYRFTQAKIKERASKAGKAAHTNSLKQQIKNEVAQKFKESIYPFHKRGYTAKFVKEMSTQYPEIDSIKTFENWVAALKKGISIQQA